MLANVRSFAGFRHASRPSLRPLLFSGEDLREDVNVFVAGKNIASLRGIQTLLAEGDEVALFPAAIGG